MEVWQCLVRLLAIRYGCFLCIRRPVRLAARSAWPGGRGLGVARDPERAAVEAARRARGMIRRYCAANRLNRLGTLTYAGEGCHDPRVAAGGCRRVLQAASGELGGEPFPYLWVPEWHPGGHGLHLHFAVGRYVKQSLIREYVGPRDRAHQAARGSAGRVGVARGGPARCPLPRQVRGQGGGRGASCRVCIGTRSRRGSSRGRSVRRARRSRT